MRTVKYMDEEKVIKKAMQVLIKELGPVEAGQASRLSISEM
jgi:hypothetical protein